jgi:thioredoxin-like negative regulator of GroEL
MIIESSNETWKEDVVKSETLVVVFFWSPTCPYCVALKPILEETSREYVGKLKFVSLNVSVAGNQDLSEAYGVMSTPTLKIFCNGRPITDMVGLASKEDIKEFLNKALATYKTCLLQSSPLYYV